MPAPLPHHHHHESCTHKSFWKVAQNSSSLGRIIVALSINTSFAGVEMVGGYLTGSVAVMSSALHDFGDSLGIGTIFILELLARLKAGPGFSYGYRRLSLLASLAMGAVLLASAALIAFQAITHFWNDAAEQPHGLGMVFVSIVGIGVNGFATWTLRHGRSQTEKIMSWHFLEDLLSWISILIAGGLLFFYSIPWLDPVLSLLISAMIVWGAGKNLKSTAILFLQGSPQDVDQEELRALLRTASGVHKISEFKLWSLDGEHHVLTLKIVVSDNLTVQDTSRIAHEIRKLLESRGMFDLTAEFEGV